MTSINKLLKNALGAAADNTVQAKKVAPPKRKARVGVVAMALFAALAGGACVGGEASPPANRREVAASQLNPTPITQFTKIFVIGDSLSDTHRMGSGLIPYCPNSKRGYWNKRFSNGCRASIWCRWARRGPRGIGAGRPPR